MKKILFLLVLALGLFGAESEEIGALYIQDERFRGDAVLSPDGNGFYTLKDDLVTQWQISPVKKLLSFKTGIVDFGPSAYQINVSNDGQRIILYSPKTNEIQLWDVKTMKHLKTIKEDLQLVTGSKYGFISLTKDNHVHVLNDKDLTLIKNIDTGLKDCTYPVSDEGDPIIANCRGYGMTNGDNVLSIVYSDRGLFPDLDTLKITDYIYKDAISYYNGKKEYADKYADKFIGKFAQKRAKPEAGNVPKTFEHTFSSLKKLSKVDGKKDGVITLIYSGAYYFVNSSFDEQGKENRKHYILYLNADE